MDLSSEENITWDLIQAQMAIQEVEGKINTLKTHICIIGLICKPCISKDYIVQRYIGSLSVVSAKSPTLYSILHIIMVSEHESAMFDFINSN